MWNQVIAMQCKRHSRWQVHVASPSPVKEWAGVGKNWHLNQAWKALLEFIRLSRKRSGKGMWGSENCISKCEVRYLGGTWDQFNVFGALPVTIWEKQERLDKPEGSRRHLTFLLKSCPFLSLLLPQMQTHSTFLLALTPFFPLLIF